MQLLGYQREGQNADALLAPEGHLHLLRVADALQDGLHLLAVHANAIVLVTRILCKTRPRSPFPEGRYSRMTDMRPSSALTCWMASAEFSTNCFTASWWLRQTWARTSKTPVPVKRQPGQMAPPYVNCPLSPLRSHQTSQERSAKRPSGVRLKWEHGARAGFVLRQL